MFQSLAAQAKNPPFLQNFGPKFFVETRYSSLKKRDVEPGLPHLIKHPLDHPAPHLLPPEFQSHANSSELHGDAPSICADAAWEKGGVPNESLILPCADTILLPILHRLDGLENALLPVFDLRPGFMEQAYHLAENFIRDNRVGDALHLQVFGLSDFHFSRISARRCWR